ncbi:MAG TPA: AAA family ATPase [Candidatus Limnocylindrales bacterium]|nr:AAA family ATPase [Candidatus Limnocylindrales bacterium]
MEFGVVPRFDTSGRKRIHHSLRQSGHISMEFCSKEPQPPGLVGFKVEGNNAPVVEIRRGRGRGGPLEIHVGGKAVGGAERGNFRIFGVLPMIYRYEYARLGRPSQKHEDARWNARLLTEEFRRTISSLRAVGAFRAAPERRYDYQGRPPDAADLSGQNVVYALIDDSMRRGKRRGNLISSLNRWLYSVGRVQLLPLRRISSTARLYELRLKDAESGRWANFADVGFGIGQALPVLVEGLRTPNDGLFIVQEPEIHLHPDAQLAMADYLVDLASSGRTVIVETHSEALLLRVRQAVLDAREHAGKRPLLHSSQLSIIHVRSDKNGNSHAKALSIDELGQVQDWPEGFMDEVTSERLSLLDKMVRTDRRR